MPSVETFRGDNCFIIFTKKYCVQEDMKLLHYSRFFSDMAKSVVLDKDRLRIRTKQIKTLQLLFLLLPRYNVLLLECLVDLLHRVTKVSENMMTSSSLGTVFAPHLLCPRKVEILFLTISH